MQAGHTDDERAELLLAVLERCDCEAALLASFYAALESARQPDVVRLLREG